jgi:hypothetical protein
LAILAVLTVCGGDDDGSDGSAETGTAAPATQAAAENVTPTAVPQSSDETAQITERSTTKTISEATFGPDNESIAGDQPPAGAEMSGDQAQVAVLEYLKAHRSSSCRSLARQPGWFRKYFGDDEWQVALSPALENAPSINPFRLEGEEAVGVQQPRIWKLAESTGEIAMIQGNPPC